MCQVCEQREKDFQTSGSRRRIWELPGGWHCSVIGTCLTLGELRSLAKKCSLKIQPDFPADYQIHGFFTQQAGEQNKIAKLLNKLLDRRYSGAIKKARALKTSDELEKYWNYSLNGGDVAGPYWAIISHPCATYALSERAFADIHMLSHIVGASNRGDIRKIRSYEEELVSSSEKLSKQRNRYIKRQEEKDQEILALQENVLQLRSRIELIDRRIQDPAPSTEKYATSLGGELLHLKGKLGESATIIAELQSSEKTLTELANVLQEENKSLELALLQNESRDNLDGQIELDGLRILYVGGRPHTVHRLRSLVETWNGELIHHDGGLERSIGELARAVTATDLVIFPTDRVSHDAAITVKRLCRQTLKPYKPVRSSGIASFVAGLRDGLEQECQPQAAQ